MIPVSNVDRLVLLLRQRLIERQTPGAASRSQSNAPSGQGAAELHHLQALAAIESLDDRQLKRALIQSILSEQFGSAMINDAKFQQVVDRVTEAIDDEPGAAGLLSRVIGEMRDSAR